MNVYWHGFLCTVPWVAGGQLRSIHQRSFLTEMLNKQRRLKLPLQQLIKPYEINHAIFNSITARQISNE